MVTIVSDGGSLLRQWAETSQFGGGNAAYLDQLYEDWLRDPQSVAPQWRTWFQSLRGGTGDVSHADAIARIVAAQRQGRRAGVPMDVPTSVIVPVRVVDGAGFPSRDAEIAFATPKSVTVADPPESRMLSGLMSR